MLPTSRRAWLFLILIITLCLLVGAAITTVLSDAINRGPSLRVLAQEDAGEVAMRDGRLSIYTEVDHTHYCDGQTTHWLFTEILHNDKKVRMWVPVQDGPIPYVELGIQASVLSVPLPPGLWPGDWYWIADRVEYCGFFGNRFPQHYQSEPTKVDVERLRASPDVPVTAVQQDGKVITRSRSPVPLVTVPK